MSGSRALMGFTSAFALAFIVIIWFGPASRLALLPTDDDVALGGKDELIFTQMLQEDALSSSSSQTSTTTKIAFVADAGLNKASRMVLEMLKQEEVDMVLHTGDLDYTGRASEFYRVVDDVLGRNFPYIVTMGNYEARRAAAATATATTWTAYQRIQRERLARIPGMHCSILSRRSLACCHRGVSFITSAIGVNASRLHDDLQALKLSATRLWGSNDNDIPLPVAGTNFEHTWRVCSWHLPLFNLQVGFRQGVQWMRSPSFLAAYELCRKRGAIIINGHEHYYVRTHTITRFALDDKDVKFEATTDNNATAEIAVGPGSTFAAVSGLAGHSVSVPNLAKQRQHAHLAKVHPAYLAQEEEIRGKYFFPEITGNKPTTTSEQINLPHEPKQGYPFGALICALDVSPGSPQARGECYFKTIAGRIVDQFVLAKY